MIKQFSPSEWGRDHWSLLLYCEDRTVNWRGHLDLRHLRMNVTQRGFQSDKGLGCPGQWNTEWATRANDGSRPDPEHDDLNVFDELEAAGLVENVGSGINPVVIMTARGRELVAELRAYRAEHHNVMRFVPSQPVGFTVAQ